jgi:hypothetical protein
MNPPYTVGKEKHEGTAGGKKRGGLYQFQTFRFRRLGVVVGEPLVHIGFVFRRLFLFLLLALFLLRHGFGPPLFLRDRCSGRPASSCVVVARRRDDLDRVGPRRGTPALFLFRV